MPDWKKLTENLEKHGFAVSRFATAAANMAITKQGPRSGITTEAEVLNFIQTQETHK